MARSLIIIGTGGSAHDVLDVVDAINSRFHTWEVVGFLDDARTPGDRHLGREILGPISSADHYSGCAFINVIGSDQSYPSRPQLIERTNVPRERFATLIHPQSGVSTRARIGHGVLINYGASVAGNVTIGDQVSVGPRCVIGHDSVIEPFAMLAPAAIISGHCLIGEASYIGAGAMIRQKIRVGESALVGLGAVVVKDVFPGTVVIGNPACPYDRRSARNQRLPDEQLTSIS